MLRQRKQKREQLDRIGRQLVRASTVRAQSTDEIEAADAPFLYQRIKVAIAIEQQRLATASRASSWLGLLVQSRHATPAVLVITFATISFLFTATLISSNFESRAVTNAVGSIETSASTATATTMEQIVFNEEDELLSSDAVLATLVGDEAASEEEEQ